MWGVNMYHYVSLQIASINWEFVKMGTFYETQQ